MGGGGGGAELSSETSRPQLHRPFRHSTYSPAQATESNPNPNEGILDFSLHYENAKHIL